MFYIGVDLGGTKIAVGLVQKDGALIAKKSAKTDAESFAHIMDTIADTIAGLLEENGFSTEDVEGIGIGCPGSVDSRSGVVIYANNIRLDNAPVAQTLRARIGKPVFVSNDANCAALGENVMGGAKGLDNLVLITLGTGVGGGIIIDGKIFDGNNGTGGEPGHSLLRMNGEACTCGLRGCWEAYASATALIRQTKAAIARHPESSMSGDAQVSGRTAFEAAKRGDKAGRAVVARYLRYVAEGIVNMVNIFRPDIVLIGGGISHEGDYILRPIQRFVDRRSYGAAYTTPPRVKLATLGNDAGIIGAAMLCRGK
ncbi:MAG: ROK family protein [Clostridia bacterium]|nr:ROK family protein [Clostridia bacterium]